MVTKESITFYVEDLSSLAKLLTQLNQQTEIQSLLVFAALPVETDHNELSKIVSSFEKPLLGGFFPAVLYNGERKSSGFLLIPVHNQINVNLVSFDNKADTIANQIDTFSNQVNPGDSLFLFLDAFATEKSAFIHGLYDTLGPDVCYFGGGAGSLSLVPGKCVITNSGLHQNAAAVGVLAKPLAIAVAHGWQTVAGPFKVTATDGNKLLTINGEPAFEVYKTAIFENSGNLITSDNFFDIAKSYPFGMVNLDSNIVIRDPLATEHDAIIMIDRIETGQYVYLMYGNLETLIEGAASVVERHSSKVSASGSTIRQHLIVDCISRVLYMGEEFDKELEALGRGGFKNGILTIGEIANDGEIYLEIFNKTTVVSSWIEKT